jgi:hypothetical protein
MIKYRGISFPDYNVRVRTPGAGRKFAVLVKRSAKVRLVRFGDPDPKMRIKKNIPARKKSYCARSAGIPGSWNPFSANFWSRREWEC